MPSDEDYAAMANSRNREAACAATANNAVKADGGKPPMGLLPWPALWDVAKVLDYGKAKYAAHNWRKGMEWSRLHDAALRHLTAFIENQDLDEESQLPHLAHCACCILFLATYQKLGLGIDDRWKGGNNDQQK